MKFIYTKLKTVSRCKFIILLCSSLIFISIFTVGIIFIKRTINEKTLMQERTQQLEEALKQAINQANAITQKLARTQSSGENKQETEKLKKELDTALKTIDAHKKALESLQKEKGSDTVKGNSFEEQLPTETQKTNRSNRQNKYGQEVDQQSDSRSYDNEPASQKKVIDEIKEKATTAKVLNDALNTMRQTTGNDKKIPQQNNNNIQDQSDVANNAQKQRQTKKNNKIKNVDDVSNALDAAISQQRETLIGEALKNTQEKISKQIIDQAKGLFSGIRDGAQQGD